MAKYRVGELNNKNIWERFVLSRKPQSFLQSWNWGETNRLIGKKILRLGFYEVNKLVGVCLLIKEEAKRGPHLVIPGGPIIDFNNHYLVKYFIESVKSLAVREKVWFIRVRPELLDTADNKRLFKSLGLVSAPMHLHAENTWVLDITKSEEELMKEMRKSTRYEIRKSLKLDLIFDVKKEVKYSKILSRLQDETVKRHKFVGFSEKLFKAQLETFGRGDQAIMAICRKGKYVLATAIIILYSDTAYYHHSASTLKFKGVPASHFLQWNIIKYAKERGIKYYNFWGITPKDNPKHRFWGVTMFKRGFGGSRVDWLHAHDIPTNPLYYMTYIFETARRFRRHL